jgi:hypothetical protein
VSRTRTPPGRRTRHASDTSSSGSRTCSSTSPATTTSATSSANGRRSTSPRTGTTPWARAWGRAVRDRSSPRGGVPCRRRAARAARRRRRGRAAGCRARRVRDEAARAGSEPVEHREAARGSHQVSARSSYCAGSFRARRGRVTLPSSYARWWTARRAPRAGRPPRSCAQPPGADGAVTAIAHRPRPCRPARRPVPVGAGAFLTGQLSVGWSNDWIDAARDARNRRPTSPSDKAGCPVAAVRTAALTALALCVPAVPRDGTGRRPAAPRRGGRRLVLQRAAQGRPPCPSCRTPWPSGPSRRSWCWPCRARPSPGLGDRGRRAARRGRPPVQRPARPRGGPRAGRARAARTASAPAGRRPAPRCCC